MTEYYKHSGAVSVGGLLGGAILGMGVAAGLSAIYAYGVKWIPIVYVSFLLTAGFGFAIGGAVYFAAKKGKVRNNGVVAAVGLLCGLVGVYYAWAFDMVARAGAPFTMDPATIWDYMQVFNEKGDWSIGRHAKENVTGLFLWFVWAVEAGVIVGLAAWIPYSMMSESVFCEQCDQWTKEEQDVRRLASDTAGAVVACVTGNNLEALRELPSVGPDAKAYVRLDLKMCESCDQSNYLTVASVETTTNKKGEESTETSTLVKHLLVGPNDVISIREAGILPNAHPEPDSPIA